MISIFHGKKRGLGEENEDTSHIFVQMSVMFRDQISRYKGAKLHALLCIMLYMDQNGWSRVTIRTLNTKTGYNKDTLVEAIKALHDQGDIYVVQVRERSGVYGENWFLVFPSFIERNALDLLCADGFVFRDALEAHLKIEPTQPIKEQKKHAPKPQVEQASFVEPVEKEKSPQRALFDAYSAVVEPGRKISWGMEAKGAQEIQQYATNLAWTKQEMVDRAIRCWEYYNSFFTTKVTLVTVGNQIAKWVDMGMPAPREKPQARPQEEFPADAVGRTLF